MLIELSRSFLFGATVGLAIGPIAILIMQKGIAYGLKPAILSGIGAAFGDATYAFLAFNISANIINPIIRNKIIINYFSSLILFFLGAQIIFTAYKNKKSFKPYKNLSVKSSRHFLSTYLLTLSNPLTIIMFIGFAGKISHAFSPLYSIALSSTVFFGSVIIQIGLALTGAFFGNLGISKNRLSLCYLNMLSGCLIVFFGLSHFR